MEVLSAWYKAFYGPNQKDYSVGSDKYNYFVLVSGYMSHDEWQEHYPRGTRYGR